jgi:DNA-binding NtrC family response regulator
MQIEKKIKLLIVDDNIKLARSLKSMICNRYSMIEAETAASGYEALRIINHGGVDAVLTDVSMKGMDGCDLYIKIMQFNPKIQVMMMSAFYDANHAVVRAKLRGLKDVLPSPELIEKRELVDKIFIKIEQHFLNINKDPVEEDPG